MTTTLTQTEASSHSLVDSHRPPEMYEKINKILSARLTVTNSVHALDDCNKSDYC